MNDDENSHSTVILDASYTLKTLGNTRIIGQFALSGRLRIILRSLPPPSPNRHPIVKPGLIFALIASAFIALIAWPIGGNLPHARSCTMLIALAMVVFALFAQFERHSESEAGKPLIQRFSWIWLFISIGTAYASLQVVPSQYMLGLSQLVEPARNWGDRVTTETAGAFSAHPTASRELLVDLIAAVGIFFASFSVLRKSRDIKFVFGTTLIAGAAIGFVGIIQKLAWNGKVLWVYDLLWGGVPFGPFVNKNSAGGFLLACFAGAVLLLTHQMFNWEPFKSSSRDTKKEGLFRKILGFIAGLKTQHMYAFALLSFVGFSVVATLSRGAAFALAVAALVAVVMVSTVNRWALVLALLVVGAGTGLALYAEQTQEVSARMESLTDINDAAAPRLMHWEESLPYIKDNLALGTGIGTHRYLYLGDQQRHYNKWFLHAENVYLETLGDLGVGGLAILLLVLALCIMASWSLFQSSNTFDRALGVSGMCLLTGQMVSAVFDFGIYSPANYGIVAVMLGAVAGRAATLTPAKSTSADSSKPATHKTARIFRVACLILIGVGLCWALREAHAVDCRRHAHRLLLQYQRSSGEKQENLDQAQWLLERAIKIRPDDYELNYQMGEYHVARFRQAALNLIVEPEDAEGASNSDSGNDIEDGNNGPSAGSEQESEQQVVAEENRNLSLYEQTEVAVVTSIEEGWPVTSLSTMHRFASISKRMNQEAYDEIVESPEVVEHLNAAWESFLTAEKQCQALAKTQFRLAQLSIIMDDGESEADRIRETRRRSPRNSKVLFDCGVLALNAGDVAETAELWGECLSYSRVFEEEIVQFGRSELPMRTFYEKVLPQDPVELLRISRKYFSLPEQTLPKRLLLVHTRRLVEASVLPDAQKSYLRAETQRMSGDLDGAAKSYEMALDGNDSPVEWRFVYATTLYDLKRYEQAIDQLNKCLRTESKFRARASRLITKIKRERVRNVGAADPSQNISSEQQ